MQNVRIRPVFPDLVTYVYDIDVFTLSTGTALSIGCPFEFFGWPSRDARSAFKAWVRPRGEPDPS